MMKGSRILWGFLLVFGLHAFPLLPVSAQERDPKQDESAEEPDEASPDEDKDVAKDEEAEEADKSKSPVRTDERVADIRRMGERLSRLRHQMNEKLNLDGGQKRTINELFEDYLTELKQSARKPKDRADKEKEEEVQRLREELKEAQASGDRELTKEIRTYLREALRERRGKMTENVSKFIGALEGQLKENQIPKFREILRRLGLGKAEPGDRQSLENLLRAVMDPTVGLSQEKRQAVVDIMRDTVLTMDPDRQDREEILAEIATQIQAEIIGELTEGEWEKVEGILAQKSASEKGAGRPADRGAASNEDSDKGKESGKAAEEEEDEEDEESEKPE